MFALVHTPLRRLALAAALIAIGGLAPWWGRRALGTLAFFRVRTVEVQGAHYLSPQTVVDRLGVDTLTSVWSDLRPLAARVRTMPGVRDAIVERMLPSTIVVRVSERTPIALAATTAGLRAYDGTGAALPIDPTREDLDLPIVERSDAGLLKLLAGLHDRVPAFYAQISQVRRAATGELVFQLAGLRVLAWPSAEPQRFATVPLVTADLSRRRVHAQEIDLRFRDQVVARWQ